MVDPHGERGTTLAELLVVIVLLSVVGSITTVGIVSSFRAQRATLGVSATLDESRVAIQRMRDAVRRADEVCAGSDGDSLIVWTDRRDDGVVGLDEDVEVQVFTVDDASDTLVRATRNAPTTTLISDEIVNSSAVFTYGGGIDPDDQDVQCNGGSGATTELISQVDITVTVRNPSGNGDLTTGTSVKLRNSGLTGIRVGLAGAPNQRPVADIVPPGSCVVDSPCTFDGTGSSDPEGQPLTYAWEVDGVAGVDGTASTIDVTYTSPGTKTVSLVVDDGEDTSTPASATVTVVPVGANQPPVAAFTFRCTGGSCSFDATNGSLPNRSETTTDRSSDPDGDPLTFSWSFPGQSPSSASTPQVTTAFSGTSDLTVSLTVSDGAGGSDTSSVTIKPTANAIRIKSLAATGSSPNGSGRWDASVTVRVTSTLGTNINGAAVSFNITGAKSSAASCTTGQGVNPDGYCTVKVQVDGSNAATFTVGDVTTSGSTLTYDPAQNEASTITISQNGTANAP